MKMIVPAILSGMLAGCATVGKPFEFAGPDSIQINRTTKDEVQRTYGDPFRVGYDKGNLKWTYGHYRYSLFGNPTTKDLVITFNRAGIVTDYDYSVSPAYP